MPKTDTVVPVGCLESKNRFGVGAPKPEGWGPTRIHSSGAGAALPTTRYSCSCREAAPGEARVPEVTIVTPGTEHYGQKRGMSGLVSPHTESAFTNLASSSGLYLWKCPLYPW